MAFRIEPLEADDIDNIIDIYWRACEDPKVNHPLPLILHWGVGPDARELLWEEFEPNDGRWEKRYTMARDTQRPER